MTFIRLSTYRIFPECLALETKMYVIATKVNQEVVIPNKPGILLYENAKVRTHEQGYRER